MWKRKRECGENQPETRRAVKKDASVQQGVHSKRGVIHSIRNMDVDRDGRTRIRAAERTDTTRSVSRKQRAAFTE